MNISLSHLCERLHFVSFPLDSFVVWLVDVDQRAQLWPDAPRMLSPVNCFTDTAVFCDKTSWSHPEHCLIWSPEEEGCVCVCVQNVTYVHKALTHSVLCATHFLLVVSQQSRASAVFNSSCCSQLTNRSRPFATSPRGQLKSSLLLFSACWWGTEVQTL